jgi:hypothetical protein
VKSGAENKSGKPTSHRYNRLPLLPSGPGGVQQELVVPICRCKSRKKAHKRNNFFNPVHNKLTRLTIGLKCVVPAEPGLLNYFFFYQYHASTRLKLYLVPAGRNIGNRVLTNIK